MKYLYNGGPEHVDINPADVLEVSISENKFMKMEPWSLCFMWNVTEISKQDRH